MESKHLKDPLENVILGIVRELLYNDSLDASADLFEAGLNSIMATQMMSKIQAATGIELALHEVFDHLGADTFNVTSLVNAAKLLNIPVAPSNIPHLPESELYQVSYVQRRLWLLEKFNGGEHPSSIPVQILFREAVDVGAIELSLRSLIERHESLRTTYVEDELDVLQRIIPSEQVAFKLLCEDHAKNSLQNTASLLGEVALQEARHIFDLSQEILLRGRLLKINDREYHLFITVHHIASDGWSTTILLEEFFKVYDDLLKGKPIVLPSLPTTYKEYAAWLNHRKEEKLGENAAFWNTLLGEPIPRTTLPSYKERPAVKTYHGKRKAFIFSKLLTSSLKTLSQRNDTTLFNTLIALLNVLFYRYTGNQSVTFGSSVANRAHHDLQDLVGYFLSVVAIRTNIPQLSTFLQVLEVTKKTTLNAFRHQEYPFDQLVKDNDKERDLSYSPIFDVVVLLHNYDTPIVPDGIQIDETETRTVLESDNQTCIVDLFLEFFFYRDSLTLNIRYDTAIFDESQVSLFFTHLENLAAKVSENPNLSIDDYDFLTPVETARFDAPAIPSRDPVDVITTFDAIVAKNGRKPAILLNGESVTYAGLRDRTNNICSRLSALPFAIRNEIVCVFLDRSPDFIASLLAIWKVGGIYLPIEPTAPASRIDAILKDSNTRVVITSSQQTLAASTQISRINIDESGQDNSVTEFCTNSIEAIAYVIYTSGSTGSPKGAVVSHRGMLNHLQSKISDLKLGPASIVVQNASQSFDISIWQMIAPLMVGGTVVITDQRTIMQPDQFVATLSQLSVTHLEVVPSYLSSLLNYLEEQLHTSFSALRMVLVTGETLIPSLTHRWFARFPGIVMVNAYGPTEASDDVTHHFITKPVEGRVSIGKPIINTSIYVLSQNLGVCPEGATGELYVAGEGVGYGYLNDPEKTASAFGTWRGRRVYKTGDMGRYLPDDTIDFFGRRDQQIKMFGYRIELEEIEHKISAIINADMVAVVLCKPAPDVQFLAAFVQISELDIKFLQVELRKSIPDYMVPGTMTRLDKLPLTSNGKIDRKALIAMATTSGDVASAFAETPTEQVLHEIWSRVLMATDISVVQDFFRAGGSSLLANQIALQVHRRLGVKIELRDVFSNPTIRSLAARVDAAERSTYAEVQAIEEQDYYKISHSQKRMWILNQIKEDQIAYNVHGSYVIEGKVNPGYLASAVEHVVRKHDILRTTFPIVDGVPVQRIMNELDVANHIVVVDANNPIIDEKAFLENGIVDLVRKPFNLEEDILFRVKIIQLAEDRAALLIALHHIISDGWSRAIVEDELFIAYNALLENNQPPADKHLQIQFRDYSAWQNKMLASDRVRIHKEHWIKCIQQEPLEPIELLSSRTRPAVQSFNGSSLEITLPSALKLELYRNFQNYGATPFMGLISIVLIMLRKLTGQHNLVIGSTLSGRSHANVEKIVGFFVNTLPLRYQFAANDTFTTLVHQVKEKVLQMMEHESYPIDLLIDDLNLSRDVSRNAIFDVLVEVHQFEKVSSSLRRFDAKGYYRVSELQTPEITSIYDLNFVFKEANDDVTLHLRYNTDLFMPQQIARFLSYFEVLCRQILQTEDVVIDRLIDFNTFLQPQDARPLTEMSDREDPTIPELIAGRLKFDSAKVAVKSGDVNLTYAELVGIARKHAAFYGNLAGFDNPIAGLLMDRSEKMVLSILALWTAQKAYLPLDTASPIDRLTYIINDANLQVLVFSKDYVREAQTLLWACKSLKTIICVDSTNVLNCPEPLNESMKKELWEYIGAESIDEITGGGWINSYTATPFSQAEMDEYASNALIKLTPYLASDSRVLEIGCASGISMFRIAPKVASYVGTDLSDVIIQKNLKRVEEEGIDNISLYTLEADQIDRLPDADFDVVIINSVVQNFNGLNYLRNVISKAVKKLNQKGIIFLGDIMDLERKPALISSLSEYYRTTQARFQTKLEWDDELFVHKDFLRSLAAERDDITSVSITDKIFEIANELTDFRYDAILEIDKHFIKEPRSTVKNIFDAGDLEQHGLPEATSCAPSDIAYVIYTSGSTGNPKGAVLEHRGLSNHILTKIHELNINDATILAQNASHCFDISIWQMFAALVTGGQVVIYNKEIILEPSQFLRQLSRDKVTLLEVVPTYLNEMLDVPNDGRWTTHLTALIVTGEVLHKNLVTRWFNQFPHIPMVNAYGPTEASDDITHHVMTTLPDTDDVPIGMPLREFDITVVDRNGNPCAAEVRGELWVRGRGVGRGYLNNPEKTHDCFCNLDDADFRNRVYKTGDTAKFNLDGTLSFIGREDFQVKIRGHRIELGEIENQLLHIFPVREAVVIARRSDDDRDHTLEAFLTVGSAATDSETIRRKLSRLVPSYMVPDVLHIMDRLPVNLNGKIDRKKLLDRSVAHESTDIKSASSLEMTLLDIWEKVLGRSVPALTSNFFEIGGHSLKATRLLSAMHQKLDVKITLKDIFLHPTIKALAAIVASKTTIETFRNIPLAPPRTAYELSHSQKRLWVLSQFEGGMLAYCENGAVKLTGNLKVDAFAKAVDSLIERHESLRTTFAMVDGEPRQQILPHRPGTLPLKYFERSDADFNAESFLADLAASEDGFDLARGPLMRYYLVKTDEQTYFFLFSAHHIICDGWSGKVFLRDILDFYSYHSGAQNIIVPPLAIQYKDYAEWLNREMLSAPTAVDERYWRNKLTGTLSKLDLPTSFSRPPVFTHKGTTFQYQFERDTYYALKSFAQAHHASLFMTLVAVLDLLLYRYTGQTDIFLGTTVSGRNHQDLEDQIGFFLNTVVLRSRFSSESTFNDLIDNVKDDILQVFQHQQYPFDKVIENVNPRRDLSRSPLFDVLVELQSFDALLMPGDIDHVNGRLKIEPLIAKKQSSQIDMNWSFHETDNKLNLQLVYNTDLYSEDLIRQYIEHFASLCTQVTHNSNLNLFKYELTKPSEIQRLGFRGPLFSLPQSTFIDQFEAIAKSFAGSIAVKCGSETITYGELNANAQRIADLLVESGTDSEDLICVWHDRNIRFIEIVLGVFKAGCAYVPMDPLWPAERILEVITDSKAFALIADNNRPIGELASQWKQKSIDTLLLASDNSSTLNKLQGAVKSHRREKSTGENARRNSIHHLAYVIYTSGSTGKPKGVMIEQAGMLNHLWIKINELGITTDSIVAQNASQSFDISIWQMLAALIRGGQVVIYQQSIILEPAKFVKSLESDSVSILEVVPSYLKVFLDVLEQMPTSERLRSLKHLLVTGEVFKATFANSTLRILPDVSIVNAYGPTEASDDITHFVISKPVVGDVPIGHVLGNLEVLIVDEHLNVCPPYVKGEICVTGVGIGRGYLNDVEKTDAAFISNPHHSVHKQKLYRTGDIGRYTSHGIIEFFGRKDTQIKIRGYRIELGEIENRLISLPGIDNAAVKVFEDNAGEKFIVGYVTTNNGTEPDREFFNEHLKRVLPDYLIPSQFVVLGCMPVNSNGKIDYIALTRPELEATVPGRRASDELETLLVALWEELFPAKAVSIDSDFFDLGGDSIKAIQLASKLHKSGFHVEIKDVFQYSTIASLKSYVVTNASAQQTMITGVVPLGPSQIEFFKNHKVATHHYNMSALLEMHVNVETAALETIFEKLCSHHDMLRATFDGSGHECEQVLGELRPVHVNRFTVNADNTGHGLKEVISNLQSSFDLATGPLIRAAVLSVDGRDLLLIIVHHLVFDGVSWRILLEDLEHLLKQHLQGDTLTLGLKTTSYKEWIEKSNKKLSSADFTREAEYWKRVDQLPYSEIGYEMQSGDKRVSNTILSTATIHLHEFDQAAATRKRGTEMLPYLLTALGASFESVFEIPRIAVMIEGHARDSGLRNINISRTIGWFASDYPVVLSFPNPAAWQDRVAAVREILNTVPGGGSGYALARHSLEGSAAEAYQFSLNPQIRFNYMGQFETEISSELFSLKEENTGTIHSPELIREYDFEISVVIFDNVLEISVAYNRNHFSTAKMEKLSTTFSDNLRSILSDGRLDQDRKFTLESISDTEVDLITKMFN